MNNALVINTSGGKFVHQGLTVIIIAYKTGNIGFAPQQSQIMSHISTAAHSILNAQDMINRHRCLWRNSANLSIVISIQHYISHYQNSGLGNAIKHKIQQLILVYSHIILPFTDWPLPLCTHNYHIPLTFCQPSCHISPAAPTHIS